MATFRDHFSSASPDYARFRPRYPRALFDWIADEARGHDLVWDCATGSGQAARDLAGRFARVVASDASAAQLAAADLHSRVHYIRSSAEAAALRTGSADAITAAQAVHWFDRPAFFAECARVGRSGAVVVLWTYYALEVTPAVDRLVQAFYEDVVGPYWPPERRLIEQQYRDVEMPFTPLAPPPLAIDLPLTLTDLAGYIGTWSATHRYRADRGEDPVPALIATIAEEWGDPLVPRPTRWPLAIRAGRI